MQNLQKTVRKRRQKAQPQTPLDTFVHTKLIAPDRPTGQAQQESWHTETISTPCQTTSSPRTSYSKPTRNTQNPPVSTGNLQRRPCQ